MPPVGFRLTNLYYFDLLIRILTVRSGDEALEIIADGEVIADVIGERIAEPKPC